MRVETDLIGSVELKNELYGIHGKRALDNFKFNYKRVNIELIKAIALVKSAAVYANYKTGKIDEDRFSYISSAASEVYSGLHDESFPLSALQGGAGTSTNMIVNEVIANVALKKAGKELGEYDYISPIMHVNLSQSTNDVYPTALKIAAIKILRELCDEAMNLQNQLQIKEQEFSNIYKVGRTQFQDAVPVTLGAEFSAYGEAISRDRWRIYKIEERLRRINMGGTAIGTGVGASPKYRYYVNEQLKRLSGFGLAKAENLIDATSNQDVFVEVSSLLKTLAVNLNKIAKDLRILSSGPNAGLMEINLSPLQMGSSIMPGKINPIGPELIQQIYYRVVGNDLTITMAAADGELELNAMLPIIADSFLESLEILRDGCCFFAEKVIKGITANKENCLKQLKMSFAGLTEFIDEFGYDKLSEILVESNKSGKSYLELIKEMRIDKS